MAAPLLPLILAAVLVTGVATGTALAVTHSTATAACSTSGAQDSARQVHALDDQNGSGNESEIGDSNDTGSASCGNDGASNDTLSHSNDTGTGAGPTGNGTAGGEPETEDAGNSSSDPGSGAIDSARIASAPTSSLDPARPA